ncbi:hypothetical protein [Planctomyces sp. SH-PL62]|uniref:hypothetical protein n=1 Tax=Planctomyces sp. SH-PL62 TaxID=1636152 RepID=UPI00078B8479|nr:hypothetical protein [Planctomyces sp. SH-PL62]AMV39304.1 hypothetical protein VT85_17835 [Planctomyces sp. SH-PL62]
MQGTTILTVTKDAEWLMAIRPFFQSSGRSRLVVAETIEEADRLLEFASPRLVVVDWKREGREYDALPSLLWKNSIQARPASVMIVAENYRVDEGTFMFQLGVDEYVGETEHREAMSTVVGALSPVHGRRGSSNRNFASLPEASLASTETAAEFDPIATA